MVVVTPARRAGRISAQGPMVVYAVCRLCTTRRGTRCQDDLTPPRPTGATARSSASSRGLMSCFAPKAARDGRPNCRCNGDRSAPAAADPSGEGYDQGRVAFHADWKPTQRARIDRDGRLDIEARQEARGVAERGPYRCQSSASAPQSR
jgi:hypothetical protein